MKFGVCIPSHRDIMPIESVIETPQRAEELGYDSVWVNDHIVVPNEALQERGFTPTYYEPFMILAHAAARTNRVKLGSSIIVLPIRHPLAQAKMLSTLDMLSGGRVIFGVGAGWAEGEFRALGIPFEERGAISDETLRVINEVWTNDAPSFNGRYYSFSDIQFSPKPLQKPRIPIWVGGMGRAAVRRAAEFGDAWHPNADTHEAIETGLRALKEHWRKFGRQGEPTVTQRMWCRLYPQQREGQHRMGLGTVDQVSEDIKTSQRLGIDYVVLDFAPGLTEEQWNYNVETFAREIMPQFA